jgi:hypothetical protein
MGGTVQRTIVNHQPKWVMNCGPELDHRPIRVALGRTDFDAINRAANVRLDAIA